MRRITRGSKISVDTEIGVDTGVILYHEPSPVSRDVYMVRWGDGTQTLFEVKKENLVKDEETARKKTT